MRVVIIGAGAAGCFCAVNLKRRCPDAEVIVLESKTKALAKVAITGGGRCNLTNSFLNIRSPKQAYPRGEKFMKRGLKVFSNEDTMEWFEREGVRLLTQEDECVFPVSQDAMEIVNTLLRLMQRLGVRLILNTKVTGVTVNGDDDFTIATDSPSGPSSFAATHVVVTTGGTKQPLPFAINGAELETLPPVPSLFTFNIADTDLHALMGTVVEPVTARLSGTKLQAEGALLITHWGLSGPAILKLSSYAARHLAEHDYKAELSVNWFGEQKESEVFSILTEIQNGNPQKQLSSEYPRVFNQRHWLYIINKVGLTAQKRWQEVGPKQMNRLASLLTNDLYAITGKGQFKDEFVTCGGVAFSNLNLNTLECKNYPGLFFAGEVTDIDAITGGFNLQAAWTMGYIVSQNITEQ